MNEFEKIKERLENRSNDAEAQMYYLQDKSYLLPCMYNQIDIEEAISKAYCDAKDIVSEVESEYINKSTEHINKSSDCSSGWIPCSERLPEAYDIASKPILERPWYLVSRECGSCEIVNYETIFGKDKWIGNSIVYEDVIAWMPLPEPYKPEKGEQ